MRVDHGAVSHVDRQQALQVEEPVLLPWQFRKCGLQSVEPLPNRERVVLEERALILNRI